MHLQLRATGMIGAGTKVSISVDAHPEGCAHGADLWFVLLDVPKLGVTSPRFQQVAVD